MKKDVKFFVCKHCGNIAYLVNESGAPLSCCGDEMTQIVANTTDAAVEKHVPDVTELEGNSILVKVGSVEHPMVEEHFIQWIVVATDNSIQIKYLLPGEKPEAVFTVNTSEPYKVYEYCNLHGLWLFEK